MFCRNCGQQLRDRAAFCPNCGTAVTSRVTENLNTEKDTVAEIQNIQARRSKAEKSGQSGNKVVPGIMIIILVAGVAFGAGLIFSRTGSGQSDSSDASPQQAIVETEVGQSVEKVDIREVLTAYQDYIDEHIEFNEEEFADAMSDGICALIYLDDDEIPECYYCAYFGSYVMLRYKDGQVLANVWDVGTNSWCYYQEKEGRFCRRGNPGSGIIDEFFELSDDVSGFTKVDEAAYFNDFDLYGIYGDMPEMSETVEEAYGALLVSGNTSQWKSAGGWFGIYPQEEDYSRNLDFDSYRYVNSGISDFNFYYPKNLYSHAAYADSNIDNVYGAGIMTVDFTGSEGSELTYSLYQYGDNSIAGTAETVYNTEKSMLEDAADIVYGIYDDHATVIVTGYLDGRSKIGYVLTRVESGYVMQMKVIFPAYQGEEDKLQKDYITECLYRMCGFSGNKSEYRTYEEYIEAN